MSTRWNNSGDGPSTRHTPKLTRVSSFMKVFKCYDAQNSNCGTDNFNTYLKRAKLTFKSLVFSNAKKGWLHTRGPSEK